MVLADGLAAASAAEANGMPRPVERRDGAINNRLLAARANRHKTSMPVEQITLGGIRSDNATSLALSSKKKTQICVEGITPKRGAPVLHVNSPGKNARRQAIFRHLNRLWDMSKEE